MPPTDAPTSTPPGAPPPPPPGGWSSLRDIRRRPEDGQIAGVCAGLADYFDVDPLVVRVGAIALAIAGPGVLLYILAWIFVPATDAPPVRPRRMTPAPERNKQVLGILLIVLAVTVLWGDWWSPIRSWMFPLGLIGVGGWLLLRPDRDDDDLPPVPPVPPSGPWGWTPGPTASAALSVIPPTTDAPTGPASEEPDVTTSSDTTAADVTEPVETTDVLTDPLLDPWADATATDPGPDPATAQAGYGGPGEPAAPPPWGPSAPLAPVPPDPDRRHRRRRRRMIPGIVMGALLVWAGIAALLGISLQTGLAVALCIIGVGFIVGAFFGGSWILLIPGAIVATGLLATSLVDVPLDGPIGHHEYTPQQASDLDDPYQVSIGELDLDLTELTAPDVYDVDATVGVGHLVVTVPLDATVELTTDVGTGGTRIFGVDDGGVGVSNHHTYDPAGDDGQTITLHLEVGVGQIDVERALPGELPDPPR